MGDVCTCLKPYVKELIDRRGILEENRVRFRVVGCGYEIQRDRCIVIYLYCGKTVGKEL